MKTISVRELKAHWADVEKQLRQGETFEVLNRGKAAAMILPARPHAVLAWDDHLSTAIPGQGSSVEDTVTYDRESRW